MSDENNRTASDFIWAITMIVIVGMAVALVYYMFNHFNAHPAKHEIDVNISTPSR